MLSFKCQKLTERWIHFHQKAKKDNSTLKKREIPQYLPLLTRNSTLLISVVENNIISIFIKGKLDLEHWWWAINQGSSCATGGTVYDDYILEASRSFRDSRACQGAEFWIMTMHREWHGCPLLFGTEQFLAQYQVVVMDDKDLGRRSRRSLEWVLLMCWSNHKYSLEKRLGGDRDSQLWL